MSTRSNRVTSGAVVDEVKRSLGDVAEDADVGTFSALCHCLLYIHSPDGVRSVVEIVVLAYNDDRIRQSDIRPLGSFVDNFWRVEDND